LASTRSTHRPRPTIAFHAFCQPPIGNVDPDPYPSGYILSPLAHQGNPKMASFLRPSAIAGRSMAIMSRVTGGSSTLSQRSTAAKGLSTVSFDPSRMNIKFDASVEYRQNNMMGASARSHPSFMTGVKSSLLKAIAHCSGDITMTTISESMMIEGEYEFQGSEEWEEVMESSSESINNSVEYLESLSIWQISTLKRRKKMMNKHKLRKRRKKLRLQSKK